jgi:hypothetical protein
VEKSRETLALAQGAAQDVRQLISLELKLLRLEGVSYVRRIALSLLLFALASLFLLFAALFAALALGAAFEEALSLQPWEANLVVAGTFLAVTLVLFVVARAGLRRS